MADFDPYRKWLGIPSDEQPPHHYRLLGIGIFESDPDVISNAADRQMVHVRSFQSGRHGELSQQILNELAATRVQLLDTRKKGEYDAQLREQLAANDTAPPLPPPSRAAIPPPPSGIALAPPVSAAEVAAPLAIDVGTFPGVGRSSRHVGRRKASRWKSLVIAAFALLAMLALAAWIVSAMLPGLLSGGLASGQMEPSDTTARAELAEQKQDDAEPHEDGTPPHEVTKTDASSEADGRGTSGSSGDAPEIESVPTDPVVETIPPEKPTATPPGPADPDGDPQGDVPPDTLREKIKSREDRYKEREVTCVRVQVQGALALALEAETPDDFDAAKELLKTIRREAGKAREGALAKGTLRDLLGSWDDAIEKRDLGGLRAPSTLPLFGASEASEGAVDRALTFLAEHQRKDGSWSFAHKTDECDPKCSRPGSLDKAHNAATAVALLPFLAAGNGPRVGDFRKKVADGLNFLKKRMIAAPPAGFTLHEFDGGNMPSHALGTIALCEASAVDGNRETRKAATAAVLFILNTQNRRDGGWAVRPWSSQPPTRARRPVLSQQLSDVYSTGWNIAALKAAQWAALGVNGVAEGLRRAGDYLESPRVRIQITVRRGGRTTYGSGIALPAVAMLAQMHIGWPRERDELVDYVKALDRSGPAGLGDFSLNYYNAQVMRHFGGPQWKTFNAALRDSLVAAQVREGHAAGSWNPSGQETSTGQGGRLFCTALAALTLEVCYRHPPLDFGK